MEGGVYMVRRAYTFSASSRHAWRGRGSSCGSSRSDDK
jgi:hypothetical protein